MEELALLSVVLGESQLTSMTRDISGVFVYTNQEIAVGAELQIVVTIPPACGCPLGAKQSGFAKAVA